MFSSQNPASSSPWAQLQRVWIYRSQAGLASGRSGQQTRFTSWHTRRTDFCLPQPQSKTGLWGSGTKITSVSTKWILYSRGSQPFINRVPPKEQKKFCVPPKRFSGTWSPFNIHKKSWFLVTYLTFFAQLVFKNYFTINFKKIYQIQLKKEGTLVIKWLKKTFCVPPGTCLRTTSGTRTTGWEPLT